MAYVIKNPLNHLQQKDVQALLGKSERQIRRYDDEGLPGHGEGRGRYYVWDDVLPWWIAREAGSKAGPGTLTDKEREQKARADLAEMDAEERAGALLDARAARRSWEDVLGRLRSNLRGFPARLLRRLEGVTDPRERLEIGNREMDATLRTLSDGEEVEA